MLPATPPPSWGGAEFDFGNVLRLTDVVPWPQHRPCQGPLAVTLAAPAAAPTVPAAAPTAHNVSPATTAVLPVAPIVAPAAARPPLL
jgi:hypothetical protein